MAFWNMGVAINCRSILMLSKVDLYDIKEINNVTGMNQSYTIHTKYGTILILLYVLTVIFEAISFSP